MSDPPSLLSRCTKLGAVDSVRSNTELTRLNDFYLPTQPLLRPSRENSVVYFHFAGLGSGKTGDSGRQSHKRKKNTRKFNCIYIYIYGFFVRGCAFRPVLKVPQVQLHNINYNPPCGTITVDLGWERKKNFKKRTRVFEQQPKKNIKSHLQ